jgi:hypothetical protein
MGGDEWKGMYLGDGPPLGSGVRWGAWADHNFAALELALWKNEAPKRWLVDGRWEDARCWRCEVAILPSRFTLFGTSRTIGQNRHSSLLYTIRI